MKTKYFVFFFSLFLIISSYFVLSAEINITHQGNYCEFQNYSFEECIAFWDYEIRDNDTQYIYINSSDPQNCTPNNITIYYPIIETRNVTIERNITVVVNNLSCDLSYEQMMIDHEYRLKALDKNCNEYCGNVSCPACEIPSGYLKESECDQKTAQAVTDTVGIKEKPKDSITDWLKTNYLMVIFIGVVLLIILYKLGYLRKVENWSNPQRSFDTTIEKPLPPKVNAHPMDQSASVKESTDSKV